jgi:hypothetical protein
MSNTFGAMIQQSANSRNNLLTTGLSSGWKQVLNAGISDEAGYIDSITAVAKKHGIAIDDMIKKDGSFTETLKRGWLTSDIMSESLNNLTKKTQGLSDEKLTDLGYTRQQIDALDTFNKSVQNGSVSLDDFAKKMTMKSGRENLIEALRNSLNGLLEIIKPIKEAWRDVFPAYTGEQLYALTEKIKNFTAQFKLSGEQSENLKRTFKGLFAILDIGKQAFTAIAKGVIEVIKYFAPAGNGVLSFTGSIGDLLVSLDNAIKKSDAFNNILGTIERF